MAVGVLNPMIISALQKSQFNQPCNSCGKCCTLEPCKLSQELLNCHVGPCVALVRKAGRLTTACGLITDPAKFLNHFDQPMPSDIAHMLSSSFANALGADKGCDADDDPRWKPVVFL